MPRAPKVYFRGAFPRRRPRVAPVAARHQKCTSPPRTDHEMGSAAWSVATPGPCAGGVSACARAAGERVMYRASTILVLASLTFASFAIGGALAAPASAAPLRPGELATIDAVLRWINVYPARRDLAHMPLAVR